MTVMELSEEEAGLIQSMRDLMSTQFPCIYSYRLIKANISNMVAGINPDKRFKLEYIIQVDNKSLYQKIYRTIKDLFRRED